jgi:hypothetical protein
MKPIMSVKEARKLLSKDAKDMTDEQIEEPVEQTHELAKLALDVARDKILREKRDEKSDKPKPPKVEPSESDDKKRHEAFLDIPIKGCWAVTQKTTLGLQLIPFYVRS